MLSDIQTCTYTKGFGLHYLAFHRQFQQLSSCQRCSSPREPIYGCNLLSLRGSQRSVVIAALKDTCERCSLSCIRNLPGMQAKIKSSKLKLSALCSLPAFPPAAAARLVTAATHMGTEPGRHHSAKDALGIGKHHPAEHHSSLQCKCAQAEAAADILSLAL